MTDPQAHAEMAALKTDIASLFAQRESLKQKVSTASRATRQALWTELEIVDKRLSELDKRYKHLWDAQ